MKPSKPFSARLRFCQRRLDNRLISYTFGPKPSAFVTPFFQSSTLKQRIIMLQKSETSRWAVAKYGFAILLICSLFVFVAACEDQSKKDVVSNQEITVSGQILSADGKPLPGATIELKGIERGTTTNAEGRYTISAPANADLLISFVGHRSQKISIGGQTSINTKLVPGPDHKVSGFLGEVTTPGYTVEIPAEADNDSRIFTVVEKHPEFPGGMEGLGNYITKNLKYPEAALRAHVSGRVYLSFVVNTDGSMQDIQILKGIGFGADEEAIRMIKAMPRWKPGTQDGKPVRVKYNLPIKFDLENRSTTPAP
ncbi:TonB family protein [Larkinella rosea]|uniref:TonB family protein n=1 Tax=Larkinella rosea TaxID=2025312 RepID=A0A3P1BDE6_9BACT|nr:TonB family protein [Larkinella rosea]RRA99108.1 TonB family protein [Larkinella rosea]